MHIKEIELNNFRIYKGNHKISLLPNGDKNIIVVSGKNGFGKTTFLMSLVWCLYGRQMEKVDELYQKEIRDKGGYGKYIGNSLNRLAASQGESQFSVSMVFTGVKADDFTCDEVEITRSFDTIASSSDTLEILIDGHSNELIHDLSRDNQSGEEIFIRDFILPLEIAKFFFFDAEKIVSLAEVNSTEQRRALSKAYSEVLGIHKYEELKQNLEGIQDDFRKKAAKPADKKAFIDTEASIEKKLIEISESESEKDNLHQERAEKKYESDQIQKKLIREGNQLTLDQLNELKKQESELDTRIELLQNQLKELFDLIPFGLAGETLIDVSNQLKDEKTYRLNAFRNEDVENKTTEILADLERAKKSSDIVFDDIKVRDFYEAEIKRLIKKHFFSDLDNISDHFEPLHDFSDIEINEFEGLISNLRLSFKEKFSTIISQYSQSKNQVEAVRRKLREAEKNADDAYVSDMRQMKDALDSRVLRIDNELEELNRKIGAFEQELKAYRQQRENLRKKIDVSEQNKSKDQKIEKLINRLKEFIVNFKEEKKKSLEHKICEKLNTLMHKSNFISKVEVDISISGEDVEVHLFNQVNKKLQKLDKGALSMGERQMYASALLNALVEESDIEFPVFIDSPMQKFDREHAENIIKHFYPNVSEQVIILPLIHKELTEQEYMLLGKKVNHSYIIHNLDNDRSEFVPTSSENLIEKYNELYVASN